MLCRCQERAPKVLPARIARDVDVVGSQQGKPTELTACTRTRHVPEMGLGFPLNNRTIGKSATLSQLVAGKDLDKHRRHSSEVFQIGLSIPAPVN